MTIYIPNLWGSYHQDTGYNIIKKLLTFKSDIWGFFHRKYNEAIHIFGDIIFTNFCSVCLIRWSVDIFVNYLINLKKIYQICQVKLMIFYLTICIEIFTKQFLLQLTFLKCIDDFLYVNNSSWNLFSHDKTNAAAAFK